MVKGNLRAARKGRLPVPRSALRALRQAQPDIHFQAFDSRVPITTHARSLFRGEIFSTADVNSLQTLISGDAAGYTRPFTKCQVYAIGAFTNASGVSVKIRETRYWARAPSYLSSADDSALLTNSGSWESGAGNGGYADVPTTANNEYWYWPEAGTIGECAYFWTLYRPAKRVRVRIVKPGHTVQFAYKFNVYLDELKWALASDSSNGAVPGVHRRVMYELQTETGVAYTGALQETVRSGIALPGLLYHRFVTKWKYRWAFGNRPSITGSNLASGLTRASFENGMHGLLARKTLGLGYIAAEAENVDDTSALQQARMRHLAQSAQDNFVIDASGTTA